MDLAALTELLSATLRIATPLMFAALGGLLSERAGTFAVGIEGMMLAGAFGGALAALATGSTAMGLLVSLLAGMALALIVAIATTRFRADQMVTGLAVNILSLGLTSFLLRGLFGGRTPVIRLPTLPAWPVPLLSEIPLLGPVLFRQPLLVYAGFLLVIPVAVFLGKTRTGLMLRAVGENPEAAFAVGTNPQTVRILAILAGGAFAGLGGAVLSLQEVGTFTDGMTNGRGFIALAAIIVGRWNPFGAMAGCLLFGAVAALESRIQGWGLPVSSYVVQMVPYLVALALLAGIGRSARMPGAIGVPFVRH
ncbi:nucleoside ABC transporter membrane protein [Azorhizobium sp. AG788]|uniref:ABC transporter permease n=1 Tax=Azorhizobium sp. AG788 TaxID=2183897 RepID=UPI0010D8F454|nr:ABC transporter permease [Azorhizobium sp. AG788]TDT93657.1 nucleoside ABC transporter membrane protein [Azorhizobium sp. AG788]